VERSFKSRGLIHNKTRNRLTSGTTSKLTFLKINAPLLHQPHRKRRPLPPGNQVQEEDPGGGDAEGANGEGDDGVVEVLESDTESETESETESLEEVHEWL
jgi:hypothetical protein